MCIRDRLEAASIGIIGGADGPTAIQLTSKLAPHMLGTIALAAYSYMALVPVIQPPIDVYKRQILYYDKDLEELLLLSILTLEYKGSKM